MKKNSDSIYLVILILLFGKVCFSQSNPYEDPYLWLEEINGEKAIEWVKEQNAVSAHKIEASPLFDSIKERILNSYNDKDKIAYPKIAGEYVYNLWKDENNQRGVWRRMPIDDFIKNQSNWEVVLDIDRLSEKENKKWVFKGVEWLKPNNEICLLFLSDGGSDKNDMREFNAKSKEFVTNGFNHPESKDGASWIDENTLLIYRDFGEGTLTTSGFAKTVRIWKRGSNIENAETVFEIDSTNMKASSYVYNDGDVVHPILINDNISTIEYYYLTNAKKIKLSVPPDAIMYGIFKNEMLLFLKSDWNTGSKLLSSGSLISLNIPDNINGVNSVRTIFSPNSKSSFADVAVSKDFITLNVMENVQNKLVKYSILNNEWVGESVDIPDLGSIKLFSSDVQTNNVFFLYSNLITPTTLYYLNRSKVQAIKTLKKEFDTDGLEINQYFAKSKDGTQIPYFIVHKSNLKYDGNNPTIIYAYGGFKVSIQPGYDKNAGIAWLERGGVYVKANIRGGGEYGPAWHTSAIKENRQNAFDDLYAVSEDLISRNITSPKKLGLRGASNGGLLVGVAYTQRPDLYNAIVCEIPLLDMKRFSKLLVGSSWISEYGDPDIPEDWEYIRKYSPYHNIREDTKYPEIFFITSTKDDRVHPGHTRKMAMKLNKMGYPYLYHEKIEGGHGLGSTNEQIADSWARIYTFFNIKLNNNKTASEILQQTINSIDTIETIYYKQDMARTNPKSLKDTIFRYREMYFKRLITDSIVGVKGHWYMYINDKLNVIYEDIYDGNVLIRKNNKDSLARIYDLVKYPEFRQKHFWSHNTLYGMQYEFKYMLSNTDSYSIERLNDTIIGGKHCFQIVVRLDNKMTMPGFATKLEEDEGSVSKTLYFIDKETYYPISMIGEYYSVENPEQKYFIDQKYYDIHFNINIDENAQFNTSEKSIATFEKKEMKPE